MRSNSAGYLGPASPKLNGTDLRSFLNPSPVLADDHRVCVWCDIVLFSEASYNMF